MRKIFISYSRKDEAFARQLTAALQDIQTLGFMDQADIAIGQPMSQLIRMYIRSADAMIVLLSSNVKSSQWVMFEIGVAQGLGIKIIPVLLPGATFEESLPEILRGVQVLDARNMPMGEVAKRIKAIT